MTPPDDSDTDRSASRHVLGVAIEPGRLIAGVVDETGSVVLRDRISMPSRDVWRSLERMISRVLAASPIPVSALAGVGVSCVGPVDVAAGAVSPPHVPAWSMFPLRDRLAELTGRSVVVDHAGGACAEAERWIGEARRVPSYLFVHAGEVVDSACVVDGVRLGGAHGNAGQIAHLTVDPGGKTCWCGAQGCLDAYVSSIALEAEVNRPLRRASPSLVERTALMLGRAIASAATMIDVTTVFINGAVVDVFGDDFLELCRGEMRRRARMGYVARLRLVEPVEHLSPLLGAAALVAEPVRS